MLLLTVVSDEILHFDFDSIKLVMYVVDLLQFRGPTLGLKGIECRESTQK